MNAFWDVVAAALLLGGAGLCLAAAVGMVRFPDVLSRMHAATKPQVLGVLMVLAGAGVRLRGSVDLWMLVLTGAFQLVTAPVAAHLVARIAYRNRDEHSPRLHADEYAPVLAELTGGSRAPAPRSGPAGPRRRRGR